MSNVSKHVKQINSTLKKAIRSTLQKKPKEKKSKKPNGVAAYDQHLCWTCFIDVIQRKAKGPGGAKTDPLLDLVLSMAYLKSDLDKLIVHCAGAAYGM